jgi:DNA-binding PadR family transcriptional regulator
MSADAELPADIDLSRTGRVILGTIALGRHTGYDIKSFIDRTARNFWAASYGQLYPEPRRLEDHGLVRGRPEPSGGRARTVYELTDAGTAALRRWLLSDDARPCRWASG